MQNYLVRFLNILLVVIATFIIIACAQTSYQSPTIDLEDRIIKFYESCKNREYNKFFNYAVRREGAENPLYAYGINLPDYKIEKIEKKADSAKVYMTVVYEMPNGKIITRKVVDVWVVEDNKWVVSDFNRPTETSDQNPDNYIVVPFDVEKYLRERRPNKSQERTE